MIRLGPPVFAHPGLPTLGRLTWANCNLAYQSVKIDNQPAATYLRPHSKTVVHAQPLAAVIDIRTSDW